MLSEKVSNEVLIDIERFSNALKWFGPIRFDSMNTIAQRIEAVMSQPWFFGDIETVESQRKVEEAGVPGGYLVRLNLGGGAKVEEAPYQSLRLPERALSTLVVTDDKRKPVSLFKSRKAKKN